MGEKQSEIRAVTETDAEIIMLPVEKMSEWLSKYETWKSFVFESYNIRLSEMLEAIDSMAFSNLHDRTFKYLKDLVLVRKDTEIKITHNEIAQNLYTSRVVISRILKQLEKEGKIKLHRSEIEVLSF